MIKKYDDFEIYLFSNKNTFSWRILALKSLGICFLKIIVQVIDLKKVILHSRTGKFLSSHINTINKIC